MTEYDFSQPGVFGRKAINNPEVDKPAFANNTFRGSNSCLHIPAAKVEELTETSDEVDARLGEIGWEQRIKAEVYDFRQAVEKVYGDAETVLLSKHADYGPKSISLSPGGPLNGLRVRMWDKLARINNLIDSGATPENESLRDSFLDLMNYSAIALLVLDGDWPE